jgi:large subunit ribosomal protein L15
MANQENQAVPLLSRLRPPPGAMKNRLRKGRGPGSGLGKTAGKGEKGQKARAGARSLIGFEGGQMPLQRRLPKRGFRNIFSRKIAAVNVGLLNRFEPGTVVDPELLIRHRLVDRGFDGVKILGNGELDRALTVRAHAFSRSARQKIEKTGGKAELLDDEKKSRQSVTQPAKQRAKKRKAGKGAGSQQSEAEGAGKAAQTEAAKDEESKR